MTGPLERLDEYDVVLHGPSADDRGAIPLGNGVLCASVWVTDHGIRGYLGQSDALTELDRTVKVCGFEVDLDPAPFVDGADTRQRLRLRDGILEITTERGLCVDVFVDAAHDVLVVAGTSTRPLDVRGCLVTWRTSPNSAAGSSGLYEIVDRVSWNVPDGFPEVFETADERYARDDGLSVLHVNGTTVIPAVAALHGLEDVVAALPDLLGGRVFGAFLTSTDAFTTSDETIRLRPSTAFDLRIATRSSQHETVDDWHRAVRRTAHAPGSATTSRERTRRRWNEYWSNSWVDVRGDVPRTAAVTDQVAAAAAPAARQVVRSRVTQAYVLTRWMTACASLGPLPLLYNGSLFTLMPGAGRHLGLADFAVAFTAPAAGPPTVALNPDERSWTVEHLWQNLRLPYHSMLQRGEPEALRPMFIYYRRFWTLNRLRARRHHSSGGQWNTEMTLTCGLQSPAVYGVEADRTDLPDGRPVNRWGGAIDLSPGLELVDLMFDYYWFTRDQPFLTSELLPYAEDLVTFILDRYPLDHEGRAVIGPLNTLETYWDTINPAPVVYGLHALRHDLGRLGAVLLERFPSLRALSRHVPRLPLRQTDDGPVLAPAGSYVDDRKNVESPELYALFPFRLHEDLADALPPDLLRRTLASCVDLAGIDRPATIGEPVGTPSFSGWQYLGPVSALLGDAARAADILSANAALANPGYRFPAMWGPVYDAVPDVDHGANILTTLQLMLVQVTGDVIRVLPAWPQEWDVTFRLFADAATTVEVEVTGGRLRRLEVTPAARRADVLLPAWADSRSVTGESDVH